MNQYMKIIEEVLPPTSGEVGVQTKTGQVDADFTITVSPRNPNSAVIKIEVADKDFVFLHLGQATTFEIPPWGGVNLSLGQKEQIELLVSAVIAGRFREELVYAGDRLVGGKGTVQLPEEDVSTRWSRLTAAVLKTKTTKIVKYEPYA